MMECYVFLMRIKVGACLIHVACLYPRKMLRTNKKPNFSAWILTRLFSVFAFWTAGDPFSPHMNSRSRIPKLNTANLTKDKFISKISRKLRYLKYVQVLELCFTLFQTQSYILAQNNCVLPLYPKKIDYSYFKLIWKIKWRQASILRILWFVCTLCLFTG